MLVEILVIDCWNDILVIDCWNDILVIEFWLDRLKFVIIGTNILLGSGSGHTAHQFFFKIFPDLSRTLTVTNFNVSRTCHGQSS